MQQIIDIQNQSSGMWAFGEGLEEMFLIPVMYVLWPILFNIVGYLASRIATQRAR